MVGMLKRLIALGKKKKVTLVTWLKVESRSNYPLYTQPCLAWHYWQEWEVLCCVGQSKGPKHCESTASGEVDDGPWDGSVTSFLSQTVWFLLSHSLVMVSVTFCQVFVCSSISLTPGFWLQGSDDNVYKMRTLIAHGNDQSQKSNGRFLSTWPCHHQQT